VGDFKLDNTKKFTNKSEAYAKYRPSYPEKFIEYIRQSLGENKIIADVGAGTGILTRQLAQNQKIVYAVEPNDEMREACENSSRDIRNISIINGTAENTMLEDKSIDIITVAQAFHWFDMEKTRTEFKRILKSDGRVVLVWNSHDDKDELTRENRVLFERLCTNFNGFSGGCKPHTNDDFFKDGVCDYKIFPNDSTLTFDEFIGRSLSASYAPLKEDTVYDEFIEGLKNIFNKYSVDGKLTFPQNTYAYIGEI
jgi:SAM-dependent methyltransferase